MITMKTEDEREVVCHKLTGDGGAVAMISGKDEEPRLSVATR
jgi:hypothetical protein